MVTHAVTITWPGVFGPRQSFFSFWALFSVAVISTVVSQQEGSGFDFPG